MNGEFTDLNMAQYRNSVRKQINVLTLLLFCSVVFSTLYYFNREATDLEGIDTYCALLLGQGKMIYRDFFFYVPPLYILRQFLAWKTFGGAILAMRILGIAERAVLFCLMFRLLCRWFKPGYAYISCLLAYLFYNTNLFNSYGDYTQVSQLLLVLAAWFAVWFEQALDEKRIGKAFWNLFIAGVLATNSLMCKHSIGAIAVAVLFLTLIAHCIAAREKGRTFLWIGCVILSFAAALVPYLVWLGSQGALMDFVNQVFFGSLNAKGIAVSDTPKETSTFARIFATVFSKKGLLLCFIGLTVAATYLLQKKKCDKKSPLYSLFRWTVLAAAVYATFWLQWYEHYFTEFLRTAYYVVWNLRGDFWLLLPCVTSLLLIPMSGRGKLRTITIAAAASICVFTAWFWTTRLDENGINELLAFFHTNTSFPIFYEFAFWGCALYFGVDILRSVFRKGEFLDRGVWYFLAIALANAVVSLMGGGTATFACNGALLTVPFAVCLLFAMGERLIPRQEEGDDEAAVEKNTKSRNAVVSAIWVAVLVLCCNVASVSHAQHIRCVYSFYGWAAMPISDVRAYTIDIPRYKGMLVSKRTKTTLEEVTKLVEKNTTTEDFVWSFPATKIYNILTDRMDQPTKVTTYFFDTCSDDQAISDLAILKENLPDLIIWKEMGEDCWEFYEKNYRNGAELGQREIQRWFESVKDSEYRLIGNAYNEYVYLKRGTAANYTYYSDGTDFVGSLKEVGGNVQRINPAQGIAVKVMAVVKAHLIPVMAACAVLSLLAALILGHDAWKIVTLQILAAAFLREDLSWSYVFILLFPLIVGLYKKEKSVFDRIAIVLVVIALGSGCLQWSELWGRAEYFGNLAIWGCTAVLAVDTLISVPVNTLRGIKRNRNGKYEQNSRE